MFFSLWSVALEVLPDDAAQASNELARCTTTLLVRGWQLGEGGGDRRECAASDDAQALASLCAARQGQGRRCGTAFLWDPFVSADVGGMLKLAHRTLQAARDVTTKCDQIDLNAKKFAFFESS